MGKANFIRTEYLARAADGVILWMVEIVVVSNIGANLGREEFGIKSCFFRARVTVQPGPICESKRFRLRRLGCSGGGFALDRRLWGSFGTASKVLSFRGHGFAGIGSR